MNAVSGRGNASLHSLAIRHSSSKPIHNCFATKWGWGLKRWSTALTPFEKEKTKLYLTKKLVLLSFLMSNGGQLEQLNYFNGFFSCSNFFDMCVTESEFINTILHGLLEIR